MTTLTPYDANTEKGDYIQFSAEAGNGVSLSATYQAIYAANKGLATESVGNDTVISGEATSNLDGLVGKTFEVKREWCSARSDEYRPNGEVFIGFNGGANCVGLEKCRKLMQFPGSTTAQEHWVDDNDELHSRAFATVPLLDHAAGACFNFNKVVQAIEDPKKVVKVFVRGFLYSVYEGHVSRVWHVDFIIEDKK